MGDRIEFLFSGNADNPDLIFVEVEDGNGKSISIGDWSKRDGYSVLSIHNPEDMYAGGYHDGLDDAENILSRFWNEGYDEIVKQLRLVRGWDKCESCGGDGKNHNPTTADLAVAILESMSAQSNYSSTKCKTCYGLGVIEPKRGSR